ncbi:unnamed protein product [Leptidea sinapis]|uniref:Uncharacterized protein n=1 Tax=Leptidea sinapis TaxID=189913 RepID=A0A5E4QBM2_9NEOP|nr:unnamed protein product [Leptidea sinapis]
MTWANVAVSNAKVGGVPEVGIACSPNPIGAELILPTTENAAAKEMFEILLILLSAYQFPNLPLMEYDLDILLNLGGHVLVAGALNANHNY